MPTNFYQMTHLSVIEDRPRPPLRFAGHLFTHFDTPLTPLDIIWTRFGHFRKTSKFSKNFTSRPTPTTPYPTLTLPAPRLRLRLSRATRNRHIPDLFTHFYTPLTPLDIISTRFGHFRKTSKFSKIWNFIFSIFHFIFSIFQKVKNHHFSMHSIDCKTTPPIRIDVA